MIAQEEQFRIYLHAPLKAETPLTVRQLKLSALDAFSRTDNTLATLIRNFNEALHPEGKAFGFRNDDVFIVYSPKINENQIKALLIKTGLYFSADSKIENPEALQRTFVLPAEKDALNYEVSRIESTMPSRSDAASEKSAAHKRFVLPPVAAEQGKKQLTPAELARISKALVNTDFSNMIRRQFVCIVLDDIAPSPMFEEVFVSIADLGETILPDVSLTATPWLFQDLTETLDKCVLTTVSRHDDGAFYRDFSLNLNVSSILSEDFKSFDKGIRENMKASVVLELQPIDIVSDFSMYVRARDFAQSLGYKICIDGVSALNLPFIDREKLGADFVKLTWQADLPDLLTQDEKLKEKILSIGSNRTILCRVDDEKALNFAKESKITLLQGRYIQHLLSTAPRRPA